MKAIGRLTVALLVGSLLSAGAFGCHTVKGAGKDIQEGGKAVENASDSVRNK